MNTCGRHTPERVPIPADAAGLIEMFCTPPFFPETEYDRRACADAEPLDVPFEDIVLKGYAWGDGPVVLLLHGWGSRASHMASIARVLSRKGFRAIAIDMPGHGGSMKEESDHRSSLPRFCRALACVAGTVGKLHAVVGHSLGGAAAVLTAGGSPVAPKGGIDTERLVAISSPAGLETIVDSFCRMHDIPDRRNEIMDGIESGYGFPREAYSTISAARSLNARLLIVHDRDDPVVPFADAEKVHAACPTARLVITEGARHREILANRIMLRAVREFFENI